MSATSFTAAQLSANASALQNQAGALVCTIDGVAVQGLANQAPYRVNAVFSYTLPDNPNNVINWLLLNFCSATPPGCYAAGGTVSPAATDGVFVMVAPLPKGKHQIHVSGSLSGSPFLDITYNLTVQ